MRRPLVLGLALVVSGCAGLDSSTPGVAPAPGRRGDGHREARAAPRVARDTDPVAAWETVQTRVRRGEAAGVLADAQRLAAAAEAGGNAGSALTAHTAAAYAALRLSRLDTGLHQAGAAVAAGGRGPRPPLTAGLLARAARGGRGARRQARRPP